MTALCRTRPLALIAFASTAARCITAEGENRPSAEELADNLFKLYKAIQASGAAGTAAAAAEAADDQRPGAANPRNAWCAWMHRVAPAFGCPLHAVCQEHFGAQPALPGAAWSSKTSKCLQHTFKAWAGLLQIIKLTEAIFIPFVHVGPEILFLHRLSPPH